MAFAPPKLTEAQMKEYGLWSSTPQWPSGGVKNYQIHKVIDRATGNVTGFKLGYQMDYPSGRDPSMELWNITPEQASAFQALGIPINEAWGGVGGAGSGYSEMGALPLTGYPAYIPQITVAPGVAASTTPAEITPYMQAIRAGTAAGQTPAQISQQYAGTMTTPTTLATQGTVPAGQKYKIQSGDTLSALAQKFGTSVAELMKANPQIKDPNLIYAGASLNIPGTITPTPTAIPPTTGVGAGAGAGAGAGTTGGGAGVGTTPTIQDVLTSLGGGTAETYRQQMANLITGLTGQMQQYQTTMAGMPSPQDIYTQYREQLGLPTAEAQLTATNVQIQKTQQLLDNLEKDINARIQGKMITEPVRRRELAVEQRPLQEQLAALGRTAGIEQAGVTSAREQLSQMLQLAQTEQQRQAQIAGMPYEMTTQLLPTLTTMAQYQTPQEQLAQYIAQLQAQAQVEQQYKEPTAPKAPTMQEWGGRMYQWDGTKWVDVGPSEAPETALKASDATIRNWILENKRANPNISWYDLWGQLADELKRQGLNPANYDKVLWEILHPEGLAGYEKYVKGAGGLEPPF